MTTVVHPHNNMDYSPPQDLTNLITTHERNVTLHNIN